MGLYFFMLCFLNKIRPLKHRLYILKATFRIIASKTFSKKR
jgi:hypothetical protein